MHQQRIYLALAVLLTTACASVAPDSNVARADRKMTEQSFSACQPRTDSPPKLISGKAPVYPVQRMMSREQGYAVIEFDLTATGRAENFKQVESSNSIFYTHTRVAVADWIFEPALLDGAPITVRCQFRQMFILR